MKKLPADARVLKNLRSIQSPFFIALILYFFSKGDDSLQIDRDDGHHAL